MNKLALASVFSLGMGLAMSMTIDETVNISKKPFLPIVAAIKIAREHTPRGSVVSQATSYCKSSNEWWVVICRSPNEADGVRTNYICFVSAQYVRTVVNADSDRGLPKMPWDVVLSEMKNKTDEKEGNVVSMGWVQYPSHGSGWIVRCVNGCAYEFVCSSGEFRLIEKKKRVWP